MNYFELFDFPVAPVIDRTMLAEKYFQLQKNNHPDFFTRSSETEQEDSLKLSADINKAFSIFQNQQRTIEYFLQTVGLISENEKYELDPGFLAEMMEINEAISEGEKENAIKLVDDYEAGLDKSIYPVLNHYEKGGSGNADLEQLKEYYFKKKYLNRILDRLGD